MKIQIQDGNSIQLEDGANGFAVLKQVRPPEGKSWLGLKINGKPMDFAHTLTDGDSIELLTFDDPDGRYVFWHTSAHVLAQAILRHYPDAKPTIGPPIEEGFFYDFADLKISEEDFGKIETEIKKIVKENFKTERIDYSGKEEALALFGDNQFKRELIESFDEGLSGYKQGEFLDLCRGPHLPSVGMVKAFKILKTSGAFWRGDKDNPQLTRVYAISFPDKQQLAEYLVRLEEAKKRDHRVLGKKLDLFSFQTYSPGMAFIHPPGMKIWKQLMSFWHELHMADGYCEIKTPMIMSRELWEISGHWQNYRENMYFSEIDDRTYAIKPMNCPGCMLFFKSGQHSYRDLPMRVAEIGHVHRHELSGVLSGLFRVRSFHQDDSHLFMRERDIESEIIGVINLADKIYSTFGLSYRLELSTRPEKSIGSDHFWEVSTEGLRKALEKTGREYKINEGDGAFYGPKIDFHIQDAIGRNWQCGTIQLDMILPEKFDLLYDDEDGTKKRPIMLHRALFGSIERFMGILIENFTGNFPLWFSPRQIRVLPVADRHVPAASELCRLFSEAGFEAELDDSSESVSKKVRNARILSYNYVCVVGDQEAETGKVALRTRNGQQYNELPPKEVIAKLSEELNSRSLISPYDSIS